MKPGNRFLLALLASLSLPLLPNPANAQSILDIAVGERHACTLDDAGIVDCRTAPGSQRLAEPDSLPALTDIAAGQQHTCGITLDGDAVCWGNANFNALEVPPLDAPLVSLAAGANHTCAVDTNADVVCWGLNTNLQLEPPATDAGFSQVEASINSTCGLLSDGGAACWSTDSFRNTMDPVAGPFTQINTSATRSCGLTSTGEISCFLQFRASDPVPTSSSPYIDFIVTRRGVVCGLTTDGQLDCEFRLNTSAEIRAEYQAVSEEFRFTAIASSEGYGFGACGIRADDSSLLCFGSDLLSNLSNPSDDGNVTAINLGLSAVAYDQNAIELFWNRQPTRFPQTLIEIYRDGELIDTTDAMFSFFDRDVVDEPESTYSIRAIDENGNTGPFSNEVTVSRENPGIVDLGFGDSGLFNPREGNSLRIENISLTITGGDFLSNQGGFSSILVTWNALDDSQIPLAGYEIRLNNETVAFTNNTLYFNDRIEEDFCGVVSVLAIDDDGGILETTSAALIPDRNIQTCL